MIGQLVRLTSAAVLALSSIAAPGQEPPGSNANPFDRPDFVTRLGSPATPAQTIAPARLDLRATLVGAGTAFANINGQILAVGQSYEGYRIVSIREGHVVVNKDGERTELDIYKRQQGAVEGRE